MLHSRETTAIGFIVVAWTAAVLVGCGGCAAEGRLHESPSAVASVTVTSTLSWRAAQVFVDLAKAVAPTPVYGLAELPADSTVPAEWWPVLEMESAESYQGPSVANPLVLGAGGGEAEAQLLLDRGTGWLVLIANFRGDLGDVSGTRVGDVAGADAFLYEVNGGTLVQWSDEGRWYGVFGRGVPEELVVETALGMKRVAVDRGAETREKRTGQGPGSIDDRCPRGYTTALTMIRPHLDSMSDQVETYG